MANTTARRAIVVGASRTLGLGLAMELARRGWRVTGTTRGARGTDLHESAPSAGDAIEIEHVDITDPDGIRALRARLEGSLYDLLFVNAGITGDDKPVGEVTSAEFATVMETNALGPLRVVEILGDLVAPSGSIAIMSSRQGSVSLNTRGGHEVYRASKSALNQLMRSYAARSPERSLMLIHPGWVQTELGGDGAPLTVADSVPGIVDVLERHAGESGIQFRDYRDEVVPW